MPTILSTALSTALSNAAGSSALLGTALLTLVLATGGCKKASETAPGGEPQPSTNTEAAAGDTAPKAPATAPATAQVNPQVTLGSCDIGWLPKDLVVDLTDEEAKAFGDAVLAWSTGSAGAGLSIEGGLLAASSAIESASDEHPSTPAGAKLACDADAAAAADAAKRSFNTAVTTDGITCEENVCCYSGMEFVPSGLLVGRKAKAADGGFAIAALVQVASAGLKEEAVDKNIAEVTTALQGTLGKTCSAAPAK